VSRILWTIRSHHLLSYKRNLIAVELRQSHLSPKSCLTEIVSGNHSASVEDSLTCMGSGNNTKEARDRTDLFSLRREQRYFFDTATWNQAIWY
jgi:hypothetical protein